MKRLALAAFLPLRVFSPAPAAEPVRLERLLPEKCPCVFLVEDAPALLANWEKSGLAKAWADPAIMKFLAPLRLEMGFVTGDEVCRMETGLGVKEIRIRDETGAYRVVYVATFSEAVYVLHAFEKNARKTPKPDIELARRRFRDLVRERRQR